MCCTWFAHCCAWATWEYVLETVRSAVRRLSKTFEYDYYYYYYYYYYYFYQSKPICNTEYWDEVKQYRFCSPLTLWHPTKVKVTDSAKNGRCQLCLNVWQEWKYLVENFPRDVQCFKLFTWQDSWSAQPACQIYLIKLIHLLLIKINKYQTNTSIFS